MFLIKKQIFGISASGDEKFAVKNIDIEEELFFLGNFRIIGTSFN